MDWLKLKEHMKVLRLWLYGMIPLMVGCAGERHRIIASSGTALGVEVSQNPVTGLYYAKLGYNRAELAMVPTNRRAGDETEGQGNGAADVSDVIMELKYSSPFSFTDGGIYQRLAVGPKAVTQPGASFMFARDASGQLTEQAAQAVAKTVGVTLATERSKLDLGLRYENGNKTKFNEVAKQLGYLDFPNFLIIENNADKISQMASKLAEAGL